MIVPQNRLLFWFAVVALPFSVVAALLPGGRTVSLVVLAGWALVAALDAALGHGRLEGLSLELPAMIRCSRGREGTVAVRVRNEKRQARQLRLGLVWPPQLQPANEDQWIELPASQDWSRLEMRLQPLERGRYWLKLACLETASPLGFWALRGRTALNTEIRVYPNLFVERKNLAALFLNRGVSGIHTQRQVGKGREFEKLRDYMPGDSFDDIHWKATAKRGHPVTKMFQIERTQEVYVVIDASRLSGRKVEEGSRSRPDEMVPEKTLHEATGNGSGTGTTVLERYVTAALVLGLAAERQGDLFGLVTFSDQVQNFVRAKNGKAHYHVCRDSIYRLGAREVTPDFEEVATFIRLRLRRRALLVFLTALDDPMLAESFTRSMDLLCRQHLLLVNMMKPPAANPLFSGMGVRSVDDLYLQLGGHLRWQSLQQLGKVLQRRGIQFGLLEDAKLSAQLVSKYLAVKQRQLL